MIKDLLRRLFKKSANPYPKSFAKRLTRRITLRMLIIMGIPSFILFWFSFNTVRVGFALFGNKMLKGQYEEVRRITSDIYVASVNTAPFIEDNLDNPDKLYDIMEGMISKNSRIRSCGISFVANYYPQKGRWFCPYAVRRDSTIERLTIGSKDHDYLKAEWFQEAVAKDSAYWAKPFFEDHNEETPLMSYLVPIHDRQQRVVAILGVDMSLNWFSEKLMLYNRSRTDSSEWADDDYNLYYFVIDSAGTFLAHPDNRRIGHDIFQNHVTDDPDGFCKHMLTDRRNETDDGELSIGGIENSVIYRPVKYTTWTVGLVLPKLMIEVLSYLFGGFMLFFIVIGILVVLFSGRRTIRKSVKPIKLLAQSADEVAKGNFNTLLPELNSRDEIHQLRDSFAKMQLSLSQHIEQLKSTTAEKASIESELKVAHNIQMSMLPKTFPPYPERNDIDIYGQVAPAKAVGGDLFDFYIRDEKLFFCIGDVSGKGVPASMFMAVARSLFRNVSAHVSEPHIIAKALNDSMSEGNEMSMFVTMFIGVLDLQTGLLRYCNAGHDAPLLIGQGVGVLPCESNLPIGLMDWEFVPQETTIASGTTIFLYTDGLNEAENSQHQQFGEEQILQLAEEQLVKGECQPMPLIQRMSAAVHFFAGAAEQSDDLTMLAIQYKREASV
ncbi:MAG: SpoIIE family protein phosphatase [Prevotella sp.]|nr:SpoIIE family protein phosphatase [Prevotella sp.]